MTKILFSILLVSCFGCADSGSKNSDSSADSGTFTDSNSALDSVADSTSAFDSETATESDSETATDSATALDTVSTDEQDRQVYIGTLDSEGNATVTVPEISFLNMPLVLGYVFSSAYAEPGYVMLGNIIPAGETFRFAAGAGNANADFRLVVVEATRFITGTLDDNGDATLSIPEITLSNMPLVIGYVHSAAYAEPGYVPLGNIIPNDGSFRFAAGAANANAPYILVIATSAGQSTGTLDETGSSTVVIPEISLSDLRATIGYVHTSAYAEPGYVLLGNILPADGVFRFSAGLANATASYLVTWSE